MSEYGSTIRQARNAVSLVIGGAVRTIESGFADPGSAQCRTICNNLIDNLRAELDDWLALETDDERR